jgi:hypothetical protein
LKNHLRGSSRIRCTKVADDANAVGQTRGQHRAQQVEQQGLVTRLWVSTTGQLRQRQGTFGQGFKNQNRMAALALQSGHQVLHHGASGIGAVT